MTRNKCVRRVLALSLILLTIVPLIYVEGVRTLATQQPLPGFPTVVGP